MNRVRPEEARTVPRSAVLGSAFQENAAKIYSFIYAKVGNRETAEDLTSQVFLKATRWLAEDRSADSVRSWLYTTARSTIVDYWREQSERQSVPLDDLDTVLFRGTDGEEEVRRTRTWALRILDTLPEREREVLRLRFLHGYSAVEIGQTLGLTPGNVRILQMRAIRRAASLHATADGALGPGDATASPLEGNDRKGGLDDER